MQRVCFQTFASEACTPLQKCNDTTCCFKRCLLAFVLFSYELPLLPSVWASIPQSSLNFMSRPLLKPCLVVYSCLLLSRPSCARSKALLRSPRFCRTFPPFLARRVLRLVRRWDVFPTITWSWHNVVDLILGLSSIGLERVSIDDGLVASRIVHLVLKVGALAITKALM